jgi:hypothetical protein
MIKVIENKIKYLLAYSNDYKPDTFIDKFNKITNQDKTINELKNLARENNTLLGRVIRISYDRTTTLLCLITSVEDENVQGELIHYGEHNPELESYYHCTLSYNFKYVDHLIKIEDKMDHYINKLKLVSCEN